MPNNFYFKLFLMQSDAYFWHRRAPKLNLLSHFCTLLYFKDGNLLSPLAPLRGKIDKCDRGLFCMKFNDEQLLFQTFLMWCIFLAALSPKLNPLSHFCTVLYFKDRNVSSPITTLWGRWGGEENKHIPSWRRASNWIYMASSPKLDPRSIEPQTGSTVHWIRTKIGLSQRSLFVTQIHAVNKTILLANETLEFSLQKSVGAYE